MDHERRGEDGRNPVEGLPDTFREEFGAAAVEGGIELVKREREDGV